MNDLTADPWPFPLDVVIEALNQSSGIYFIAATKLGCDRALVERYVEFHPRVTEAVEAIRVANSDLAEAALLKAVGAGESWAVQKQLARAPVESKSRVRGPDGRFPPNPRAPQIENWGSRVGKLQMPEGLSPAEEAEFRRARAQRMEAIIAEVAENSDSEATRVMAAARLQEIDAPKISRSINLNLTKDDVDQLSDRDLDDELTRLERATLDVAPREAPPALPGPLPDVRH